MMLLKPLLVRKDRFIMILLPDGRIYRFGDKPEITFGAPGIPAGLLFDEKLSVSKIQGFFQEMNQPLAYPRPVQVSGIIQFDMKFAGRCNR